MRIRATILEILCDDEYFYAFNEDQDNKKIVQKADHEQSSLTHISLHSTAQIIDYGNDARRQLYYLFTLFTNSKNLPECFTIFFTLNTDVISLSSLAQNAPPSDVFTNLSCKSRGTAVLMQITYLQTHNLYLQIERSNRRFHANAWSIITQTSPVNLDDHLRYQREGYDVVLYEQVVQKIFAIQSFGNLIGVMKKTTTTHSCNFININFFFFF